LRAKHPGLAHSAAAAAAARTLGGGLKRKLLLPKRTISCGAVLRTLVGNLPLRHRCHAPRGALHGGNRDPPAAATEVAAAATIGRPGVGAGCGGERLRRSFGGQLPWPRPRRARQAHLEEVLDLRGQLRVRVCDAAAGGGALRALAQSVLEVVAQTAQAGNSLLRNHQLIS